MDLKVQAAVEEKGPRPDDAAEVGERRTVPDVATSAWADVAATAAAATCSGISWRRRSATPKTIAAARAGWRYIGLPGRADLVCLGHRRYWRKNASDSARIKYLHVVFAQPAGQGWRGDAPNDDSGPEQQPRRDRQRQPGRAVDAAHGDPQDEEQDHAGPDRPGSRKRRPYRTLALG